MAELHEHNNDSATDSDLTDNGAESQMNTGAEESTPTDPSATSINDPELVDVELIESIDEIELEPGVGETPEENASIKIAELTEDVQRLTAEYANYRRRTARERADLAESVKGIVLAELLPLADDLDLAEKHGDLEQDPLKSIAGKIRTVFASNNLTSFGEPGDEFNPEVHEAIQDEGGEGSKVIAMVYRKGYNQNGKVLRTAMVTVRGSESSE